MDSSEQQQLEQLLVKYLKGECTAEESRRIQAWYDAMDSQSAEPVMEEEEKAALRNKMWAGIRNRAEENVPAPAFEPISQPRRGISRWLHPVWQAGIAAMLVLGIGWALWNKESIQNNSVKPLTFIEKVNRTDHPTSYQLSDGSTVWLKPNSLMRYPDRFRNEAREVYLEGEAFFEVAHNPQKPFRVYSKTLIVRVLGTSFTVRAFAQDSTAEVSVRTGKVTVYSVPEEKTPTPHGFSSEQAIEEAEKSSLVLTPNQKAIFYATAQRLVTDQLKQADHWEKEEAQHRMAFTNAPLEEVMSSLEDSYNVKIRLENTALENCTLTATMGNQPLNTKLEMICKSIGATFEQNEEEIVIRGKGCDQ